MAEAMNEEANKSDAEKEWFQDLFRPKYDTADLIENSTENYKSKFSLAEDFYKNIYSKVILEDIDLQEKQHQHVKTKKEERQKRKKEEIRVSNSCDNNKNEDENYAYTAAEKSLKGEKEFIWDGKDAKYFFDAYENLRRKSLKLLLVLESRNVKISQLKYEKKSLTDKVENLEKVNRKLVKENMQLKSFSEAHNKIYGSLEKKIQFYETSVPMLTSKICDLEKKLMSEQKHERENVLAEDSEEESQCKCNRMCCLKSGNYDIEKEKGLLKNINDLEEEVSELNRSSQMKDKELKILKEAYSALKQHLHHNIPIRDFVINTSHQSNEDKIQYLDITDL